MPVDARIGLRLDKVLLKRGGGCIESPHRCSGPSLVRMLLAVRTRTPRSGSRSPSHASFPQLAQRQAELSHLLM